MIKFGEVPCAFIELLKTPVATEHEASMIAFARQTLAGSKRPKRVIFQELPKTFDRQVTKNSKLARRGCEVIGMPTSRFAEMISDRHDYRLLA